MVVWPAEQDGNLFIKAGSPPFTFDTFILPIILCITLPAPIYFTHEYHNHTYLKDVFTAASKKITGGKASGTPPLTQQTLSGKARSSS